MKISITKIFIALFWVVSFGLLISAGLDDSRGLVYLLLNKIDFQFCFMLGICGILSCVLEKFYNNIIYKFFMLSFSIVACYFFAHITAQLLGILTPFYKGIDRTSGELLGHYLVNILIVSLILYGIYGIFNNKAKIARLGFFVSLLYIFLYIIFYSWIIWEFK